MASEASSTRVLVIGGGAGGLALGHYLRRAGIDDFVITEKDAGVGGTWRRNTYPGAECDVPSHLYSFSFHPNPQWSKAYAGQEEILAYLEDTADVLGLRPHIRTGTAVRSVTWDDRAHRWTAVTDGGDTIVAHVVVSALGMFNALTWPDLPGLDDFAGMVMHSAGWDHDVELAGRRVGVVGTGASSIQIVPALAGLVGHLDVFQRTPPWIMPRNDAPFTDEDRRRFTEHPLEARRQRHGIYRFFENGTLIRLDDPMHAAFESFSRAHLEASVADPALRVALTPDYPIGCKRILLSDDYYPALQRDDVELVTAAIGRVTRGGVRTADGVDHPLDVLVLATGYRATSYLHGLEVVGCHGRNLHEEWGDEPRAYRGVTVAGYPNFFMLYGPNTNQGGNSILLVLEAQARYVTDLLRAMDQRGAEVVDVKPGAMAAYNEQIDRQLEGSVWTGGCGGYFHTASGHIATQMPYKASTYRHEMRRVRPDDYTFSPA